MTRRAHPPTAGFTMIELMVVVLLLGLLMRLVIANAGAWIPETSVNSEANKLRAWVDYLRSEAKIQGKPYSLELDLDNNQMRLVLPPEDKLVTTEEDTVAAVIPMGWTALDKRVKLAGHAIAGGEVYTKNKVLITFDENGFSADQAVFLSHVDPEEKLMWTVQIRGLSGTTKVVPDREGTRHPLMATEEASF